MSGKASSLSEQVAKQITDMIFNERLFRTGDKLPNETDLAKSLKISRMTLREAIRILCTRNIIEVRRGIGTFVLRDTGDFTSIEENFSMMFDINISSQDMLNIRFLLEPMSAYHACQRGTDRELKRIDDLRKEIEEVVARGANRTEVEQTFHAAIADATHNPFLIEIRPILNRAISNVISCFDKETDLVPLSLQDHRELVRCILARNAIGAYMTMKLHIVHAFEIAGIEMNLPQ